MTYSLIWGIEVRKEKREKKGKKKKNVLQHKYKNIKLCKCSDV